MRRHTVNLLHIVTRLNQNLAYTYIFFKLQLKSTAKWQYKRGPVQRFNRQNFEGHVQAIWRFRWGHEQLELWQTVVWRSSGRQGGNSRSLAARRFSSRSRQGHEQGAACGRYRSLRKQHLEGGRGHFWKKTSSWITFCHECPLSLKLHSKSFKMMYMTFQLFKNKAYLVITDKCVCHVLWWYEGGWFVLRDAMKREVANGHLIKRGIQKMAQRFKAWPKAGLTCEKLHFQSGVV